MATLKRPKHVDKRFKYVCLSTVMQGRYLSPTRPHGLISVDGTNLYWSSKDLVTDPVYKPKRHKTVDIAKKSVRKLI